jgi:hypothetical protein
MTLGKRRACQGLLAGLIVGVVWGCGGSSEGGSTVDGGGAKAGASGSNSGGSNVGGMGGSLVGGSNSGGSTSGGSSSGGTDGASAGGASGASAGGSSAGGSSAGGTSAGGTSAGGTSAGGSSAGGAAGATPDGSAGTAGCGTTQCTNCKDDDGDGKIDAADLQCTGAADDDEASYGTGIPGDNQDPKWQDCFFDGDSGAGNDGCRYHTDCLTGAKPATDPDCIVSQQCIDFCMPSVPNGCDCFGCCSVQLPGGGTKDVRLSPECTPATINDTAKCVPCTKSTRCNNDCGRCELCIGKPTIPPDCNTGGTGGTGGRGGTGGTAGTGATGGTTGGMAGTGGTGGSCATPTCPAGVQACGVACLPACPVGKYCLTGCCVIPPPR